MCVHVCLCGCTYVSVCVGIHACRCEVVRGLSSPHPATTELQDTLTGMNESKVQIQGRKQEQHGVADLAKESAGKNAV